MLLKQQKPNTGDGFDLSSLTLEEPASPVEEVVEVVTNISSTKVSLNLFSVFTPSIVFSTFNMYSWVLPLVTKMLPIFFLFFSLCCSTPLHLMMRW